MPSTIRNFAAFSACLVLAASSLLAHDPHDPMQVVAISPNFANDHTVLAATGGLTLKLGVIVIFKSTDGGVTWTVVPGLHNNQTIRAVVFSQAYSQDQTVYVASGGGLFMSTDGANTWSTLSPDSMESVALSPNFAIDNTLFAVYNNDKIYKSTNRGTTLKKIASPTGVTTLGVIAVSPNFANDHTLLVGSSANGIFRTANGGGAWTNVTVGLTLPNVTALSFSPNYSSDKTVFASTLGSGFLVSTTRGVTWALSNSGLTDTKISAMAFSPTYAQDSTLWVTTATKGVFHSATKGASWGSPVTVPRQLSNLTSVHYQTIATYSGVQFMGMFEGLWTSSNSGASWQYIDTCPTRFVRYVNVSPNYPNDQTVFVSTYGSGNLWTTDGGNTWTVQNTGMQAPYTDASAISPDFVNDQTAFGGNHVGLERSQDGGATWQMMTGPPGGTAAYPRGLAVSPDFANDKTVYIGTTSASGHTTGMHGDAKITAGLYVSTDKGQNWTLSSLSGKGVVSIAFSPGFATDQTAFAADQTGGVYFTTNGAKSWTGPALPGSPGGISIVAVSPNFTADGTVFAGGIHGGIYTTTNGGSIWTEIANTASLRVLDIKFSPNFANDNTVFFGTVQYGLMESTNGGATLTSVASFPDVFVSAVGISPGFGTTDQTLFAAGYHGLYKSTDGGNTWTYLITPARVEESRNVTSVLQEPPTVTYQGNWSFVSQSLASTNQYAGTSEAQDTAVFDFVGTSVDWISILGPDQGSASITLDGVFQTTVNLNAGSSDEYQQRAWWQDGLTCGDHVLTVTASTGSVALDAFDIWINGCPYTPGGNVTRH